MLLSSALDELLSFCFQVQQIESHLEFAARTADLGTFYFIWIDA